MPHEHRFAARVSWTGASQGPTASYDSYSREYLAEIDGKPALRGSSAAAFRGDESLHNPEDLLVIALSACHMLSYLAICAWAGIRLVSYEDSASGSMAIRERRMRFIEVVLRPRVVVAAGSDVARAEAAHAEAHDQCFIANSVSFPVRHEAEVVLAG